MRAQNNRCACASVMPLIDVDVIVSDAGQVVAQRSHASIELKIRRFVFTFSILPISHVSLDKERREEKKICFKKETLNE